MTIPPDAAELLRWLVWLLLALALGALDLLWHGRRRRHR